MDTTPTRRSPVIAWSDAARREVPARSQGRKLVVDYFASRCCGSNLSIGDLTVRWSGVGGQTGPEFIDTDGPEGVGLAIHRDLVSILERTGATIQMRGWARIRRPVVVLADGAAWLDFIGRRPPRSPLRH